jgi:hypothetical protein
MAAYGFQTMSQVTVHLLAPPRVCAGVCVCVFMGLCVCVCVRVRQLLGLLMCLYAPLFLCLRKTGP